MHRILFLCALFAFPLFGEEKGQPLEKSPSTQAPFPALMGNDGTDRSFLTIDPKNRSNDYVQAYEILRKDKPTLKIGLKTASGIFSNVTDISASQNGTLLFVKTLSNQGTKLVIVPIEEILEIAYLP